MMKKVFWLLILALLFAGCSSTRPINNDERTSLKKVGVISLINDELRFTKVGLTLFNNDEFTKNISGWELDKLATQSAVEALRNARPPINAVVLPADHALTAKLYRQKGEFGSYVNINRIKDDLQALVRKHPVDAVVVIHSEQVMDPIQGTCINLYGTGLYYRATPFDEQPYVKPHSFIRILVLDGKTLKPISQKLVKCVSKEYGRMSVLWEDEIKTNFSGKQWSRLQSDIKQMIKANVSEALQDIGM